MARSVGSGDRQGPNRHSTTYKTGMNLREQDGRGVGGCGVHLSPWIHQEYTLRHRSACEKTAESGQEYLTSGEEYIKPTKLSRMKELGEKTGVLVGLDLPSAGGGTEAEV